MKLPTYNTLFSVIYRSELESPNFFAHLQDTLEKASLKTDNIFLLGDFNSNLLDVNEDSPTGLPDKTRKLLNVLDSFCMQNVIKKPTRCTLTTKTSIDLIVTTKVELVRRSGVWPFRISDYNLVYATLEDPCQRLYGSEIFGNSRKTTLKLKWNKHLSALLQR